MIKKRHDWAIVRFLFVGIVNTLFGTAIMFLAYNLLHLDYWVSSALNYILASVMSYFLNKKFTFKSEKKSIEEMLKFALNIIVCYFVSYGIAKPLVNYVLADMGHTIQENGAMFVGMCMFVIVNYLGQRYFVFRK